MQSDRNTPLEHQNVPTDHQGLHSFLYSSADEHGSETSAVAISLDGTEVVLISEWLMQIPDTKIAGVYAVIDGDRTYQYIGYSRDVARSIEGHIAQQGSEICTYIRVKTFKFPKRQAMEELKQKWIADLNYIPAGNSENGNVWAGTIGEAAKAAMTEAQRNAYEEKKLKLRKAMADPTLVDELAAKNIPTEAAQRRQNLEDAVKNDDWSSVIKSQEQGKS